ncbi:MAG: HAMP domain-containing histidine kinase [Clostridia bacterium]|nr:HAMP domain-containing histidine kinase [Clostridia bacterium]
MKDIRNSNALKAICYILVPCLILIIILSAISIGYYASEIDRNEFNQYQIDTGVITEYEGDIYRENLVYQLSANTYQIAPSIFMISSILLIICMIYIIISIGHKKGEDGIYLDSLDKIPYELLLILTLILFGIEMALLAGPCYQLIFEEYNSYIINTGILAAILDGVIIYITITTLVITTIRRTKAHIFWKNTIVYKLFQFIFKGLFINFSETVKLAVEYGGFIIASVILIFITMQNPIVVFFLLGFWYYIFKKILSHINQFNKVREKIGKMYKGDISVPLDEEELYGELRQIARELNDISGGLSNAIEEATKSERLKTELITNVSHDIKTPLTSIINYVDLMKKEEIENPKVQEYLEVLDNKSQRLKKLTEDLIEASKASSGNIKLTMEKLNVKELIKQVSGEFEDRFHNRGLEIIENYPEEEVSITADSRYLYRVMENVYGNIAKYALENSRVYIDVIKENRKVQIILKNISQDKLNITVDELMQRFVRGDVSRTTEGSGLGISIAKSLTELQNGKFDIFLDGDLFKVVIEF